MATKKALGRPRKKQSEKVQVVSAYLTYTENNKVVKKYKSITNALRAEVLPKCG